MSPSALNKTTEVIKVVRSLSHLGLDSLLGVLSPLPLDKGRGLR
jgi:hypothetical protein